MEAPTTINKAPDHGWIKITNISPHATQEEVKNLFEFCGFIMNIQLFAEPDGTQSALIQFWDKEAVTTSVLLNAAIIQNVPIKVELYLLDSEQVKDSPISTPPTMPKYQTHDPVARQSKTAVMAKVFASGYMLGKDAKEKAINWDRGNLSIADKLEALGTQAKLKAMEVVEEYELDKKKDAVFAVAGAKVDEIIQKLDDTTQVQFAKQKAQEINTKYEITEKANNLFGVVADKVNKLVDTTQREIELRKTLSQNSQLQYPKQLVIEQPTISSNTQSVDTQPQQIYPPLQPMLDNPQQSVLMQPLQESPQHLQTSNNSDSIAPTQPQ